MPVMRTFVLPVLLVLTACGAPVQIAIGDEKSRTVEVQPGQEFEVAVETNASIGWSWELTGQPDPAVVTFVGRAHEAEAPDMPGSGGTDRFQFRAVGAGETDVVLTRTYRDEGPDREVTVTVRVFAG